MKNNINNNNKTYLNVINIHYIFIMLYQFDLQIPGGGVGIFDACTNMYGLPAGSNGWGKQYGGITGIEDCETFPESLKEGCKWRFNWLLGAGKNLILNY